MTEFRPRFTHPPKPAARPFWRQPRVLLSTALLAALATAPLLVGASDEPASRVRPPAIGADDRSWDNAIIAGSLAVGPPEAEADPAADPGDAALASLDLRPRIVTGHVAGYAVGPRGDAATMAAAGLRSGDVLLNVDGHALAPETVRRILDETGDLDDVEVRYERNGEIRDTLLVFRPR